MTEDSERITESTNILAIDLESIKKRARYLEENLQKVNGDPTVVAAQKSNADKLRWDRSKSIQIAVHEHAAVEGHYGKAVNSEHDVKSRVLIDWLNDWERRITLDGYLPDGIEVLKRLGGGPYSSVFLMNDTHGSAEPFRATLKVPRVPERNTTEPDRVADMVLADFSAEVQTAARGLPQAFVGIHQRCLPNERGIDAALIHLRSKPIYFSMRYVNGRNLRDVLHETYPDRGAHPPLPFRQIVSWMCQIAEACKGLHRADVDRIHRDLKPENIMIDTNDKVWIIDLGIASDRATDVPPSGSAPYMSPNQLAGGKARSTDDIWAWGVIFYELLTGQRPFTGSTREEVLESQETDPESLSGFGIENKQIVKLVESCYSPNQPQSFSDILGELRPGSHSAGRKLLLKVARITAGVRVGDNDGDDTIKVDRLSGLLGAIEEQTLRFSVIRQWSMRYHNPWVEEESLGDIDNCFHEAERSLLIVGRAGAGKTVSLLRLVRFLTEQAEDDVDRPAPVYVPLSEFYREYLKNNRVSWLATTFSNLRLFGSSDGANERLPSTQDLLDWLGNHLKGQSHDSWFTRHDVTTLNPSLCLDGIDEVPKQYQTIAINHINELIDEYGLPVTVTCRDEDYKELSEAGHSINANLAVRIDALTEEQIQKCLDGSGQSVQNAVEQNPDVRDLATTPLGLAMLYLAYSGVTEELPIANARGRHLVQHLVTENFVDRMQQRAERKRKNIVTDNHTDSDIPIADYVYEPDRLKALLEWLARNGCESFTLGSLGRPLDNSSFRRMRENAVPCFLIAVVQFLPCFIVGLSDNAALGTLYIIAVILLTGGLVFATLTESSRLAGVVPPLAAFVAWESLHALTLASLIGLYIVFWRPLIICTVVSLSVTYLHFWSPSSHLRFWRSRVDPSRGLFERRFNAVADCLVGGILSAVLLGLILALALLVVPVEATWVVLTIALCFILPIFYMIVRDLSSFAGCCFVTSFAVLFCSSQIQISSSFVWSFNSTLVLYSHVLILYASRAFFATTLLAVLTTMSSIFFGSDFLPGIYLGLLCIASVIWAGQQGGFKSLRWVWSAFLGSPITDWFDQYFMAPMLCLTAGVGLSLGSFRFPAAVRYAVDTLLLQAVPTPGRQGYAFAHRVLYTHFQSRRALLMLRSLSVDSQILGVRKLEHGRIGRHMLGEICTQEYPDDVRAEAAFLYALWYRFHPDEPHLEQSLANLAQDRSTLVRRATVVASYESSSKVKQKVSEAFRADQNVIVHLALASLADPECEKDWIGSIAGKIELASEAEEGLFSVPHVLRMLISDIANAACQDKFYQIRASALQAIARANRVPDDLIAVARNCLGDTNEEVGVAALAALGKHGGADAIPMLAKCLAIWKKQTLRIAAARALHNIRTTEAARMLNLYRWSFAAELRHELSVDS